MQENISSLPIVSIIIPCYNAEKFILQAVNSVVVQTYSNFEIICINDGSNDNTEKLIKTIQDCRINYIFKNNTGVSDTRNQGLKIAKGDFVLFLDADDILANDFLEKRILFLELNQNIGFCSSEVIKIDEQGNIIPNKKWKGVSTNITEDILSYNMEINTCPSNYLFRKNILISNAIQFNTELSCSADRFFLIELSNYTKGGLVKDYGFLYYRVHEKSMSNNLSLAQVQDTLKFFIKINLINSIPVHLKKKFCFKTNYIFAGSYYKLNQIFPCVWFSIKAFYFSPFGFFKQMFNFN